MVGAMIASSHGDYKQAQGSMDRPEDVGVSFTPVFCLRPVEAQCSDLTA